MKTVSQRLANGLLRHGPKSKFIDCRSLCCALKNGKSEELKEFTPFHQVSMRNYSTKTTRKLQIVGKFEEPLEGEKYVAGQLFLHRVFGYRGVILFPWVARVFDRDVNDSMDVKNGHLSNMTASNFTTAQKNDIKAGNETYYQVLIDSRDSPFVRAQTEAVTFLGQTPEPTSRCLYAIPGLDYVSHTDILPYVGAGNESPISHELFHKFFVADGEQDTFTPKDTLKAWQERNHPWLELSDVHKETTENVRVTVIPFYMGHRKDPAGSPTTSQAIYWWRYSIRMENLGNRSMQLRERHWRIFSLSGTLETVRGRGVVGQEPVLSPSATPAFQYSSHVSLQAPSGHMWGTFRFERDDGSFTDVKIPPFSLESREELNAS